MSGCAQSNRYDGIMGAAPGQKVLIVDDDSLLASMLASMLTRNGYRPSIAETVLEMAHLIERENFDLMFLDIELPDGDGLSVLREIRRLTDLPIMMLTGSRSGEDRVLALELGADDFVSKPFQPRELMARVRNVLRRSRNGNGCGVTDVPGRRNWQFGPFVLDTACRSLSSNGQNIPLTAAEYDLLLALVEAGGRVLSRDDLLARTRDREWQPFDRSIDVLVGRLRAKIEPDRATPQLIKTVRGGGYMLAAPVRSMVICGVLPGLAMLQQQAAS
jgi:DNA-binding response OmpR family regulator